MTWEVEWAGSSISIERQNAIASSTQIRSVDKEALLAYKKSCEDYSWQLFREEAGGLISLLGDMNYQPQSVSYLFTSQLAITVSSCS